MADLTASLSFDEIATDNRASVRRVKASGLVARGQVFLLCLDAIRDKLGNRWPRRADMVWESVERILSKQMPLPDVFVRLNDTTILAAIATVEGYEGYLRCQDVLCTTLRFFLGAEVDGAASVTYVVDITDSEIRHSPVWDGPTELPLIAKPETEARARLRGDAGYDGSHEGASPETWKPPLSKRRFDAPFLSMQHGKVAMHFEVVPVRRLDQGKVGAYAIRRHLPPRIPALSEIDREQMDLALMEQLNSLLEEYRNEHGGFALIVPVSFVSASARRPRRAIVERCGNVLDVMRQAVIAEVEGFGVGAPAGLIYETAAMMKPFFRALTAGVSTVAEAKTVINNYAFSGMAIDASVVGQRRDALIQMAHARTNNVMVHRVVEMGDEIHLKSIGASHVTYLNRKQPTVDEGLSAASPELPWDWARAVPQAE